MKTLLKTFFVLHSPFFIVFAALAAETIPVALPPCVYTGRVTAYDGTGLHHVSSAAEVRVRKGQTLLARGKVATFDGDTPCNYAVTVPMTTVSSSPSGAAKGDELTFEVQSLDAEGTLYISKTVASAGSGETTHLDLRLTSCTNEFGIDDDYLKKIREELAEYGPEYGVTDTDWNGEADWDGDGVSNYDEYLVGSNPLDENECGLKIVGWEQIDGEDGEKLMKLTFVPAYGRSYAVLKSTTTPEKPEFSMTPHRRTPGGAEENHFNFGMYQDEGGEYERVIYLKKDGPTGLFRLRLD